MQAASPRFYNNTYLGLRLSHADCPFLIILGKKGDYRKGYVGDSDKSTTQMLK